VGSSNEHACWGKCAWVSKNLLGCTAGGGSVMAGKEGKGKSQDSLGPVRLAPGPLTTEKGRRTRGSCERRCKCSPRPVYPLTGTWGVPTPQRIQGQEIAPKSLRRGVIGDQKNSVQGVGGGRSRGAKMLL